MANILPVQPIRNTEIILSRGDKKIGSIKILTADKDSFMGERVLVWQVPLVVGEILKLSCGGPSHLVRVVEEHQSYDIGQEWTIYTQQKFSKLCACEEYLTEEHIKTCLIYLVKGPYV